MAVAVHCNPGCLAVIETLPLKGFAEFAFYVGSLLMKAIKQGLVSIGVSLIDVDLSAHAAPLGEARAIADAGES